MSDVEFKELKYGFKYGDATIERHISDEKKGWVVLGLETSKHRLQIYVTKTGKLKYTIKMEKNGFLQMVANIKLHKAYEQGRTLEITNKPALRMSGC